VLKKKKKRAVQVRVVLAHVKDRMERKERQKVEVRGSSKRVAFKEPPKHEPYDDEESPRSHGCCCGTPAAQRSAAERVGRCAGVDAGARLPAMPRCVRQVRVELSWEEGSSGGGERGRCGVRVQARCMCVRGAVRMEVQGSSAI